MNKKKSKNKKQDKQSEKPVPQKREEEQIEDIDRYVQNPEYKMRCKAAIDILQAKLKMINSELSRQKNRSVISQITSRIKSAESIYTKLLRKKMEPDFDTAKKNLKDLIGIRVVCPFEDEIYEVVELLKLQKDIEILKIKDYIKDPKKNGYRSLHLIVQIPIYSADGPQKELVEIQLRTLAMDYWSVLEYQLYYKKSENEKVAAELKEYAEEIARLDGKMLKLRNKIEKI